MGSFDDIKSLEIQHRYWRQGILDWYLDSLQEHISVTVETAQAKKICILSSRQIGKSFWAVCFALAFLIRNPRKIARIIAPTLTSCIDIVNDNLTKLLLHAPEGFITRRRSDMRWELSNGSSLRLGALERQHVDSNRGGNAALIIYEEPGFVRGDDFIYGVDSVIGPQLLRSKGIEIFVSTPSEDPEHPLHTRIKSECEALGTFFSYDVYKSPSITIDMIEEAKRRCGGEHTDAFQREYMARIIRPSSYMVVPDFKEQKHLAAFDPPSACFWTVTIDWGGARDFTVAILHTYDFIAAKDLIWDEQCFPANTPTNKICEALKRWEKSWGFHIHARYADVFTQTAIDMTNEGYEAMFISKGEWAACVNGLAVKFSADKILVHPRCQFVKRSLLGGLFNKNRTDFDRSSELGHMDALAALMYGIKIQNRSNPYSYNQGMPENVFVLEKPKTEDMKLAEALAPRSFGGFKR